MRKLKISYLFLAFLGIFITACQDDDVVSKQLILEKTKALVTVGESATVKITDGNGGYTVKSAKNGVAEATVSGKSITIKGKTAGQTNIVVTDSGDMKATINVTVNPVLSLDVEDVTVKKGERKEVKIAAGTGKYEVESSNPTIVAVKKNGNAITVIGIAKGTSTVTVKDNVTNKTASFKVMVTEGLAITKSEVTVLPNKTAEVAFSGDGEYEVTSSNPDVATAKIEGKKVVVTAVGAGATTITLTDKKTKEAKSFKVMVSASLSINTEDVKLSVGEKKDVEIAAGTGDYEIESSEPTIVAVKRSENKITVTGIAKGESTITVKDRGTNQTASFKVIVNDGLGFEQSEVTLLEGKTVEVAFKGDGEYEVASADVNIATAELSGQKVVVIGVKVGETTITLTDRKTRATESLKVKVKPVLNVSTEDVEIIVEGKKEVKIAAGTGDYEVISSEPTIVAAKISGDVITVTGLAEGESIITVKDKGTGEAATFKVIVNSDVRLAEKLVKLLVGKEATVAIVGSGNYTVTSSDEEIATATIEGETVKVVANKVGTVMVTVTDTKTNKTATLEVKVIAGLALEAYQVIVYTGASEKTEVAILSGSGNYTVTSTDNAVAEVVGETIKIVGIKKGETVITVTDTETQETEKINVIVRLPLTLVQTVLKDLVQGETVHVALLNVVNDYYTITQEPAGFLSVEKGGTTHNGEYVDALKIRPIAYSPDPVKVLVKSGNQEVILTVTIEPVDQIRLKKSWTVKMPVNGVLDNRITKGNGGYTVSVENTEGSDVCTAEIKQVDTSNGGTPEYVVHTVAKSLGKATITVKDVAGKTATFKVDVKPLFNPSVDGKLSVNFKLEGDVVLPDDATIVHIDSYYGGSKLFYYNSKVTSIDFVNVNTIKRMAVMGCENLTEIRLRKLTNIEYGAFANCKKLKKVYCYMEDPAAVTVADKIFNGSKDGRVLYVPAGKKVAYEASSFAQFFSSIEEM